MMFALTGRLRGRISRGSATLLYGIYKVILGTTVQWFPQTIQKKASQTQAPNISTARSDTIKYKKKASSKQHHRQKSAEVSDLFCVTWSSATMFSSGFRCTVKASLISLTPSYRTSISTMCCVSPSLNSISKKWQNDKNKQSFNDAYEYSHHINPHHRWITLGSVPFNTLPPILKMPSVYKCPICLLLRYNNRNLLRHYLVISHSGITTDTRQLYH